MAWIRWRGSTAQLMTTVWSDGHKRQRYLASLGGAYAVSLAQRAALEARFPEVPFDWAAIDRALTAGPPGSRPPTAEMWDWAHMEHLLRDWAATGPAVYPDERPALLAAAAVLQSWRARRDQNPE